jgi:leader peptidase (prepilin peptidase) / N-methyltransferase
MLSGAFLITTIILFIIGLVIGSFLNVVIYRTIIGESWARGRSRCDDCKKKIPWYDNIPLLSFLILKGKCRYCAEPIALSHPVVEFLTGTMFVWWYWGGFVFFRLTHQPLQYVQPIFWLLVGILLLVIFFSDVLYMIIPDEAVFALTGLTLLYRTILTLSGVMQVGDFVRALGGAVLCVGFFGALWHGTKGKGMGLGDVKFALPFSLLLGWPNVLVGVFLAFISGAVVSVGLLATKKKQIKQVVPFGPFLVFATIVTLVYGGQIMAWYLNLL